MRFYHASPHRFYCGIDLHARTMHVCVLDNAGAVVLDRNLPCHFETLLEAIAPFRDGIVIGVECLFGWYGLADRCAQEQLTAVLGPALYGKAVHGGESQNDAAAAAESARLLRGGTPPQAEGYPAGMRATRDLRRRRPYLVPERAETTAPVQDTDSRYHYAPSARSSATPPTGRDPRSPSRGRTGTLRGGEPVSLLGRSGGTDEIRGRGG